MANIEVGVNSWISKADANTYFENRYGASDWVTFTEKNKTDLLITAYRWINQQSIFSIAADVTADIVKQAQCETAWYLYNFSGAQEKRRALYAQGVREFEISEFMEKLERPEFPDFISDMLEDYITNLGGVFPTVSRDLNQG